MDDFIFRFASEFASEEVPRARVAVLLEHFSKLSDDREPQRIMYPLSRSLRCARVES